MPFSATRDLWLVLKARDESTRALRSFSRDVRMVGDSVEMANLQAARSSLRNQLAMQNLTKATVAQRTATMNQIDTVDKQISQARIQKAAQEEQRVAAQKLSSTLTGVAGVMTAAGTAMIAAGAFGVAGLNNLVQSAIEYQKQSSLTRTQVDKFALSLKQVEDIGIRVANSIGVSFNEVQPALFDIFSSMEVGAADAEKLLGIFAKAAVAGQTSIQSASKATIGILNAFHLPLTDVNHLMDLQFQLVKEGVGTYEEWTQRIGLVTPSAARAGQSVETMLAALAATTRMGISAARSATAVSRAFDAMSHPAAINAMKALGVNALDAQGKFRPLIDVLGELRTQLAKLPEAKKTAALLEIFKGAGGTIEARRFLQNMLLTPGNLELFKNIFQTMSTESGSFEQAYATMADTAATKSQLIANKFEILKVKAGEALIPTFIKVVDTLGKAFDWFNKLPASTQRTIMIVIAATLAITALLGALLLILGSIAAFAAAVVVAGTSLFVIVGSVFAFVTVLAALAVALFVAYKSLKEELTPVFNTVSSAIKTKLMPVLKDLHDFAQGELVKSIKEVASNVKNVLVSAFKLLANFIKAVFIPILDMIVKYYHEHEATIKQIIHWIVTWGKYVMYLVAIIAGVLAVVLIGPVIAAIIAFIAAMAAIVVIIVAVVEGVKWLINWVKTEIPKAWHAVADFTVKIWNDIKNFFIDLWNSIVNGVKNAWAWIVNLFNTATNYIKELWTKFWKSDIGQLVLAIMNLTIAVVQLAFTGMQLIFAWFMKFVTDAWNNTWNAVIGTVVFVWNWIFPYLKQIWTAIVDIATMIWGGLVNLFTTVWIAIKNFAVGIWNALFAWLRTIWIAIKDTAVGLWNGLYNAVADALKKVWEKVTGIWNTIKTSFDGTGNLLYDAGKNLIDGLIRGITSKANELTAKIKELTQKIKDFFPHSPAKRGPLSGRGGMYYAGQNITRQLAQGMGTKYNSAVTASALVAGAIATKTSAPNLGQSSVETKQINQTFNIRTQEINPTRHSAELGFLLAGGM